MVMAENIPPLSVKLLAKALGEVDDWYQLGTVLGVPPKRLDEIRKSSPVGGTGEWRIAMLQAWTDSKSDTSWADVIEAVKGLGHIKLAAILKSKYVPKTTKPSHDAVPTKKPEVRASVAVVDRVLHVEKCFSRMLTNMRQLSAKIDINNVRFFLESILEADEFNTCKGFEDVLRLLRKSYIDAFNTSYLEQLAEYLEIDELNQLISTYKRERDEFFKDPIVTEFQDAVFNKVELSGEDDEVVVPEVIVPRSLVNKRTQRDMETLATQFCGSYREPVAQMDDVPETKNVTSNWPVYIAVLLGIATVLLIVLVNRLNTQVVELRAQLTHCQNAKRQMKECEEEVKNLTEVKGKFLAMNELNEHSLAAKRTNDLLDLLSNRTTEDRDILLKCESSRSKLEVDVRKLLFNSTYTQIVKEREEYFYKYKFCSEGDELATCLSAEARVRSQYSACSENLENCKMKLGAMTEERDQYFYQYSACSKNLEDELRKNVSMLESENDKLAKSYTNCCEKLTTCEGSCQLFTLLYNRKCFQVMRGHVELICQPIFVI